MLDRIESKVNSTVRDILTLPGVFSRSSHAVLATSLQALTSSWLLSARHGTYLQCVTPIFNAWSLSSIFNLQLWDFLDSSLSLCSVQWPHTSPVPRAQNSCELGTCQRASEHCLVRYPPLVGAETGHEPPPPPLHPTGGAVWRGFSCSWDAEVADWKWVTGVATRRELCRSWWSRSTRPTTDRCRRGGGVGEIEVSLVWDQQVQSETRLVLLFRAALSLWLDWHDWCILLV